MKDKHYSDTLQRILQGAKFKRINQPYIYQVGIDSYGPYVERLYNDGRVWQFEAYIYDPKTHGNTLAVSALALNKSTTISFDCEYDLELISE